ncbi:MAG: hypothetical protein SFT81_02840 [Candidatus Caenarcaniphilales bacterium]|nr:hypothetical protein [Candidatus Caenarcaniphilales bacterium]
MISRQLGLLVVYLSICTLALSAEGFVTQPTNDPPDQSDLIQKKIDDARDQALQISGKIARVKIPVTLKAGIYHLRKSLVLDPAYVLLRCDGFCQLDFSDLPQGKTAITISPNSDPYRAGGYVLENIHISGGFGRQNIPARKGLSWSASNLAVSNIQVSGFEICEEYGDNAYLIAHYKSKLYWCGTAIHFPAGLKNAGENISYFGAEIFDSNNGLVSDASEGTSFNFFGCSFDYLGNWRAAGKRATEDPVAFFSLAGRTRVFLSGSHLEGWDFDTPPIQLKDKASFMMQGETFSSTVQPYKGSLALFRKKKPEHSLVICESNLNQISFQGVNFIRLPVNLNRSDQFEQNLVSERCSYDMLGCHSTE